MSGDQGGITANQLLQLANTNATELDNVRLSVAWSNTKWTATWGGVAKLLEQGLGLAPAARDNGGDALVAKLQDLCRELAHIDQNDLQAGDEASIKDTRKRACEVLRLGRTGLTSASI